jgi:hypothetical protein
MVNSCEEWTMEEHGNKGIPPLPPQPEERNDKCDSNSVFYITDDTTYIIIYPFDLARISSYELRNDSLVFNPGRSDYGYAVKYTNTTLRLSREYRNYREISTYRKRHCDQKIITNLISKGMNFDLVKGTWVLDQNDSIIYDSIYTQFLPILDTIILNQNNFIINNEKIEYSKFDISKMIKYKVNDDEFSFFIYLNGKLRGRKRYEYDHGYLNYSKIN